MKRSCAAVLIVAACLSGCSGQRPQAAAPDPPPTSATTPIPVDPVVPLMPAVARKKTRAGAIAFATYYWAVVDYAQRYLDTARLRTIGGAECLACAGGREWIDKVARRGGVIQGGAHRATATQAHGARASVIVFMAQVTSPQVVTGAGDLDRRYSGGPGHVVMHIGWSNRGWKVLSWDTAD